MPEPEEQGTELWTPRGRRAGRRESCARRDDPTLGTDCGGSVIWLRKKLLEKSHCTHCLLRIILAVVVICTFVSLYVTHIQNRVKNKMDKISLWKDIEANCPWKRCFQQLRKAVCYFTCGPNCTWSDWAGLALRTCFTDIIMRIQALLTAEPTAVTYSWEQPLLYIICICSNFATSYAVRVAIN